MVGRWCGGYSTRRDGCRVEGDVLIGVTAEVADQKGIETLCRTARGVDAGGRA